MSRPLLSLDTGEMKGHFETGSFHTSQDGETVCAFNSQPLDAVGVFFRKLEDYGRVDRDNNEMLVIKIRHQQPWKLLAVVKEAWVARHLCEQIRGVVKFTELKPGHEVSVTINKISVLSSSSQVTPETMMRKKNRAIFTTDKPGTVHPMIDYDYYDEMMSQIESLKHQAYAAFSGSHLTLAPQPQFLQHPGPVCQSATNMLGFFVPAAQQAQGYQGRGVHPAPHSQQVRGQSRGWGHHYNYRGNQFGGQLQSQDRIQNQAQNQSQYQNLPQSLPQSLPQKPDQEQAQQPQRQAQSLPQTPPRSLPEKPPQGLPYEPPQNQPRTPAQYQHRTPTQYQPRTPTQYQPRTPAQYQPRTPAQSRSLSQSQKKGSPSIGKGPQSLPQKPPQNQPRRRGYNQYQNYFQSPAESSSQNQPRAPAQNRSLNQSQKRGSSSKNWRAEGHQGDQAEEEKGRTYWGRKKMGKGKGKDQGKDQGSGKGKGKGKGKARDDEDHLDDPYQRSG
ncbi:hypothetical protein F4819DRAFT_467145 [Hypoxylon fuscum]|nr:hypothetical protein F4819DRAFT_467145 [Hypoxylon fuscum]